MLSLLPALPDACKSDSSDDDDPAQPSNQQVSDSDVVTIFDSPPPMKRRKLVAENEKSIPMPSRDNLSTRSTRMDDFSTITFSDPFLLEQLAVQGILSKSQNDATLPDLGLPATTKKTGNFHSPTLCFVSF